MDPATLNVVQNGFEEEAALALKHVKEVSDVIAPRLHVANVIGHVTCYVTDQSMIRRVEAWFRSGNSYVSLSVLCFSQLCITCV